MRSTSRDLSAELAKAKRIADALGFACRLPDRKPDFFACGGPAAEAYWDYFTPARVVSLVAALETVLKLADDWEQRAMRLAAAAGDTGHAILAEQRAARSGTLRNCARELRQGVGDTLAGESCG